MFLQIGARPGAGGLVELLRECHQRIRIFARLAAAIGAHAELPAPKVIQTIEDCERDCSVALPPHVQDEELSLLPRLQGLQPPLDAALDAMQTQHGEHQALLNKTLCGAEERAPAAA